jgi:hypothetical protein
MVSFTPPATFRPGKEVSVHIGQKLGLHAMEKRKRLEPVGNGTAAVQIVDSRNAG